MIETTEHVVQTKGHCDIHDVTPALRQALATSGLKEGQALVFVTGSTAGVTTVEFEPGLVRDINEFFERLIPEQLVWHPQAFTPQRLPFVLIYDVIVRR